MELHELENSLDKSLIFAYFWTYSNLLIMKGKKSPRKKTKCESRTAVVGCAGKRCGSFITRLPEWVHERETVKMVSR